MKYVIRVLFVMLVPWSLFAQNSDKEKSRLVVSAEERAEYPGGWEVLQEYLSLNLRYPSAALEHRVSGEVLARFLIDEEGEISEIEIIKGLGFGCDEEAIRVIREMPKWNPAYKNGQAVKVKYKLPISFELPQGKEEQQDE